MAYIPEDAKWYLADIVEEFQVQDEDTSLVHINLILIRADSPEEAYERSLEVGRQSETSYQNTDGKTVTVIFRGLRNLYVIHDELEHGSELLYELKEDITEGQIVKFLRSKAELNVFHSD
jgi:hypothetical protein